MLLKTPLATMLPAVVLLSAPLVTGAQESGGVLEEVVVTGTRSEQVLGEMPGNTAVVTSEELELISATHPTEIFTRTPGVLVSRGGSGQEHLTAIRSPVFTGPGACGEFLLAQDGVQLRPTGFCNVNELLQANTEQAARIEVLRGPGTVFYGSNALHGIINVITAASSPIPENIASIEYSSDDFARLKATTSRTSGAHGYRVNANVTSDEGWRDDADYDQYKLDFRHDYNGAGLSVGTIFSATDLDQNTNGYLEGFEAYKDKDLTKQNFTPEAYRKVQSARLLSRVERDLDGGDTLTLTPYVLWGDMEFLQHFIPGDPLEENEYTAFGLQSAYVTDISAETTLTFGVDLEYAQGSLLQTQAESSFPPFPVGKHYDYDVDMLQAAPFVHGDWAFSPRVRLVGGVRFEHLEYDYTNNMIDGNTQDDGSPCPTGSGACRYSRPADRSDSFENWAAQLGTIFEIDAVTSAFVNFARAFRAPQATELYRLQGDQTVSEIESTELYSLETGLRGSRGSWDYDVSVYYMDKDNYLFRDGDRFVVSDGETEHYGIEFELFRPLGRSFDLGVSAAFSRHLYAYDGQTDGGAVISKGDDVDTAPRSLASTRLGWNFGPGGRAELEWLHVGSYYTDAQNLHKYEGHDLLHLRASKQLGKNLRIFGRIHNLTDRRYAERADFAFGDDRYFPGQPFAVFFGLEASI